MTKIAMENSPFIDDFPIKTSIYKGFSMAMLNNQRVNWMVLVPFFEFTFGLQSPCWKILVIFIFPVPLVISHCVCAKPIFKCPAPLFSRQISRFKD